MGTHLDVTSLNLVEKAEYVKCKSFAKEGERLINIFVSPLGRLYTDCEMTDGSCLWYSVTKASETTVTKAILDVLMNTTKEANREWYTSPLYKVLEAEHTGWKLLHSFYPIKIKLLPSGFFFEKEQYSTGYSSEAAALKIENEILIAQAKGNDPHVTSLIAELKSYTRDFEALLSIKDNSSFIKSCNQTVSAKSRRIEELSFLILSNNPEASSAYEWAKKLSDDVYNRKMSIAR